MNIHSIKQQIIGVVNLSMPIVIIYALYPALLQSGLGKIAIALLIGAYVYFLGNRITKAQANSLLFKPTGPHKEEFEKIITACKINPQDINIRYGYSNEMIAMTILNTVAIDQLYSNEPISDQDPEFIKVKDILDTHVVINLSPEQKTRLQKIKEISTPQSQRFIFKHELAHVFHNYSKKKLVVNGMIGACAAYCGINIGMLLLNYNGYSALLGGMLAGGLSDLFLSYASNALFTAKEETQADIFAAHNSPKEDILAAADFFEKHQMILDHTNISQGFIGKVPSVILNGHHNGFARAHSLRAFADMKQ